MSIYDVIAQSSNQLAPVSSFIQGAAAGQKAQANQLNIQAQQEALQNETRKKISGLLSMVEQAPDTEKQDAYQYARNYAVQNLGLDAANIPEQYDQKFIQATKQSINHSHSGGMPYYAVPTSKGYAILDRRSGDAFLMRTPNNGVMLPATPGTDVPAQHSPLLPVSADPKVKASVKSAVEQAKLDTKRKDENLRKAIGLETKMSPLRRLKQTAQELIESKGLEARTGLSSYIPAAIQGEDARNTEAKMTVIKSQVAQNVLQMYRNMSQTGGAVGQVSNFEQKMFQNNLAALEQSQGTDQFIKELEKIMSFAEGSEQKMKRAIEYEAQGLSVEEIMNKIYSNNEIKFLGY